MSDTDVKTAKGRCSNFLLPSGNIGIFFTQFGPYHHARVKALQDALPGQIFPSQIAAASKTYAWTQSDALCDGLVTLCDGIEEDASPSVVFLAACRFLKMKEIRIVFLPSYSPAHVFALYAAAVYCGCRRIMMNESHAATELATGWKRILKYCIVKGFHSALVGGTPQKRYFKSLGLPANKIFSGYDAIDNEYFAKRAEVARSNAESFRKVLGLPDRYFLSLGRFVPKKDLKTLIRAYADFRQRSSEPVELVLVGSGEQEVELKTLASSLGLVIRDASTKKRSANTEPMAIATGVDIGTSLDIASGFDYPTVSMEEPEIGDCEWAHADNAGDATGEPKTYARRLMGADGVGGTPAVYFMGFQQISANPAFYAFADAFILPSVLEEWGLVVNEAMACGLPVIVSRAVGSAEDLVAHDVNGFVFEPRDIETLTNCLTRIAGDTALRQRMGAESRERISKWGCENFASNAMLAIAAAG